MTFTEAAQLLLRAEGKPITWRRLGELAVKNRLLSHVGTAPEETMKARLEDLIRRQGDQCVFAEVRSGTFALRAWGGKASSPEASAAAEVEARREAGAAAEAAAAAAAKEAKAASAAGRKGRGGRGGRKGKAEAAPPRVPAAAVEPAPAPLPASDPEGEGKGDDEEGEAAAPAAEGGGRKRRRRGKRGRGVRPEAAAAVAAPGAIDDAAPAPAPTSSGGFAAAPAAPPPLEPADPASEAAPTPSELPRPSEPSRPSDSPRPAEPPRPPADPAATPRTLEPAKLAEAALRLLRGQRDRRAMRPAEMTAEWASRGAPEGRLARATLAAALAGADAALRPGAPLLSAAGGRWLPAEWVLGDEGTALERRVEESVERHQAVIRRVLLRRLMEIPLAAFHQLVASLLIAERFRDLRPLAEASGDPLFLRGRQPYGPAEVDSVVMVTRTPPGRSVTEDQVAALRGRLPRVGAGGGVIVTTGRVSELAHRELAPPNAIPLLAIDQDALAERLIRHRLVARVRTVELPILDADLLGFGGDAER